MSPKISLIAAVGEHLELGAKNELLWHLPDDFKWFVNKTKGHPIV
ncbi:MAG: dihydrofolate reductase, partial [Bacteroidia bacterium]|nr:dihydrofolate reductase [Bacteroidia bacterium]